MKTYNEIAEVNKMTEPIKTRFTTYMRMRWGDPKDEAIKCQVGYAQEWAERFLAGVEMNCSDTEGKQVLLSIDPTYYGKEALPMILNIPNGSCDTCEHKNDSGTEYCGSCDIHISNWQEARWVKDEKIVELTKLIAEKDAEIERLKKEGKEE